MERGYSKLVGGGWEFSKLAEEGVELIFIVKGRGVTNLRSGVVGNFYCQN